MYVTSTFWNHCPWKINFYFVYIEMQWHVRIKLDLITVCFWVVLTMVTFHAVPFIWCVAISCWKMILYKLKRRLHRKLCCPLKCTYKTMSENYAHLIFAREGTAIMLLKQIQWNNLQIFYCDAHSKFCKFFSVQRSLGNEWMNWWLLV